MMEKEILRSTISQTLIKNTLLKGAIYSLVGVAVLLFAFLNLTAANFSMIGLLAYLAALFFIAFGLIPYKKLRFLEHNPHTLQWTDKTLIFTESGKPPHFLEFRQIAYVDYKEIDSLYGIDLTLRSKQKLFLPYFSKSAFEKLCTIVESRR